MPLEILTGTDVPALMARAQQSIGEDAVVMSVRRIAEAGRTLFEMVAADPVTASRQRRQERQTRSGADAVLAGGHAVARPQPSAARRASAPADDAGFWSLETAPALPGPAVVPAPARAKASRFAWGRSAAATAARPPRRPRIVVLVGPTGAGKTTTIAKLANHPQAFGGRRVGLLCLDTYRIGGVEQARQYADLSRLPFEVVWEARDVGRALHRLRDCAVVLVDTPGRGPRAAADLSETQARLLEMAPDEVHLVMPAGLQRSLARRIVTAHLALGVTHLLPTKLDEYPDERGVFELARQFALPMRWVTDGQEVPRDLQPAPENPGVPGGLEIPAEAA